MSFAAIQKHIVVLERAGLVTKGRGIKAALGQVDDLLGAELSTG